MAALGVSIGSGGYSSLVVSVHLHPPDQTSISQVVATTFEPVEVVILLDGAAAVAVIRCLGAAPRLGRPHNRPAP
jgi:hypothetical protein